MIDEALGRNVFLGEAACASKEPKVVFKNYEKEAGSKGGSEPIVVPSVEVKESETKAESIYANITKAYDYGERKRKRLERILNKR